MTIWTSRYSNKALTDKEHYAVGISIGKPKFPIGYSIREQCYSLAPKGHMFGMDVETFRKAYYDKLGKIGDEKIINMIKRLERQAYNEGKDLVLLCFEDVRDPENWCHRTMLADWIREKMDRSVEELPNPDPPKNKKKHQENRQGESNGECLQLSLFGTYA